MPKARSAVVSCSAAEAISIAFAGAPMLGTQGLELLVISKSGEDRWIADLRANRSIDKVWSAWAPYSLKGRLAWSAMRTAARLKVLKFLPGAAVVNMPRRQYGQWLDNADYLSDCYPIIFIGKPSVTSKLTIFLCDKNSGDVSAVAKLPLSSAAIDSINNEAYAVQQLHNVVPGVPSLLSACAVTGTCIQSWIEGKSSGRDLTEKHTDLLFKMPRTEGAVFLSNRFLETLGCLDPKHRTIAEHFRYRLDRGFEIPAVWEHGDFVPWNIKLRPNDGLGLIDWEYCLPLGLPLLDLFHFFYRQEYLFRDLGDVHAHMIKHPLVRSYCLEFRLDKDLFAALEIYYLVRSLRLQTPNNSRSETYESFVYRHLKAVSNRL